MASRGSEDARGEFLRCALKLLEESGHESLSVRVVAARANRSSGAPYHHFPDRRALLLALAQDGFASLLATGQKTIAEYPPGPECLSALASSFLEFSRDHRRLFDLMYESELTRPVDPALQPVFQSAFDMIVNAVTEARGGGDEHDNAARAVAFWSAIFGLARLLRQRLLEPFGSERIGGWQSHIVSNAVQAALQD